MKLTGRSLRYTVCTMNSDISSAPQAALIVGCGDIGVRSAKILQQQGVEVSGVVASAQSAERLRANNIHPLILDLDQPDASKTVFNWCTEKNFGPVNANKERHIYWFLAPQKSGNTDQRIRHFFSQFDEFTGPKFFSRLIYLSTSAVYGDCDGRWIDENEPTRPTTDRGQRRLSAEQQTQAFSAQHSIECVILRVPGIYGPGRLPIKRVQSGTPVLRQEDCPFTNRIHADDLAAAAVVAAQRGKNTQAYHICDGAPSTMAEYFSLCAKHLNLPQPPQITLAQAEQDLSPAMMSFLRDSKRLINKKMRTELNFTPQYPDVESGIRALTTNII